jgi:hypothetical protein
LIISKRDASLSEMQKQYLTMGDLARAIERELLTIEDLLLIHRILIGCTKVAIEVSNRASKTVKQVTGRKLVSMSVEERLSTINGKFRPSEIRTVIPENLRNIDYSEISDILKIFVNQEWLQKSSPAKAKRGRPSTHNSNTVGKKSYYSETDYFQTVKKIISRTEIRRILFLSLFESRVSQIFLTSATLHMLATFRRRGIEDRMKIYDLVAKQFGVLLKPGEEERISSLRDDILSLKDDDLEIVAGLKAKEWLTKTNFETDSLFLQFYLLGGMSYAA